MPQSYAPPFTLTSRMVNRIAAVSELVGKLDALGSITRNPHLRRSNRIRTIHSSLAIENNTLTLAQVTNIIAGKRVLGPPDEIREVRNAYEAYQQLLRLDPYAVADLLRAHRILMAGLVTEAGVFRSGGVGVFAGDRLVHMAPPAGFVPNQIADLLAWCKTTDVHPLIVSCVFHAEFEFIHPFIDGNGRMGRMWQTLLLTRWNPLFAWLPIESLIEQHQEQYYAELGNAGKHGDDTAFVEFMLDVVLSALNDAASGRGHDTENDVVNDTVCDTVNDSANDTVYYTAGYGSGYADIRLSVKEREVLEILRKNPQSTILAIVEQTGFSRPTVTRALAALKKYGVLCRIGSDKTGHWKVLT